MSRQNHNAQYIYDLEGETVWEKLRVVRNQLEQKKLALALAELAEEHSETTLDKDSYEYKQYLLNKPHNKKNIQDCMEIYGQRSIKSFIHVGTVRFIRKMESLLQLMRRTF